MKMMKAVVLKAPGDFQYCEVPKPVCEDEGILIRVKAVGLCGSDMRTLFNGHRKVKLPWILGHEVCGVVESCGKNYRGEFKEGDLLAVAPPVYCGVCEYCKKGQFELCMNFRELAQSWPGGFAEYMALPREALNNGCIVKVDDDMDPVAVAVSEPPSSVVNAQEKVAVGLNDTVLIMGAGPIGCICVSLAQARGAEKIIVSNTSRPRLEMSMKFGNVEPIYAREEDVVQRVMELTDGKGADVIITANPKAETQIQAIECAKMGGRIALFGGLPHGDSKPNIDTNLIHYKGLYVIGTTRFAPSHHRTALNLIKSGKIPVDKLVTHRLPLEKFAEGVELVRSSTALKVVFTV